LSIVFELFVFRVEKHFEKFFVTADTADILRWGTALPAQAKHPHRISDQKSFEHHVVPPAITEVVFVKQRIAFGS